MNFLVDAHLPRSLADWLRTKGNDVLHTRDLPMGNMTSDLVVNEISAQQQRVVITKDSDFVDSFLLYQQPYKLLLISTGNISNQDLERLFAQNLRAITEAFETYDFVELDQAALIYHS